MRGIRLVVVDGMIEHVEERERAATEAREAGGAQYGASERARDVTAWLLGLRMLRDTLEHRARSERIRIDDMERLAGGMSCGRDSTQNRPLA